MALARNIEEIEKLGQEQLQLRLATFRRHLTMGLLYQGLEMILVASTQAEASGRQRLGYLR